MLTPRRLSTLVAESEKVQIVIEYTDDGIAIAGIRTYVWNSDGGLWDRFDKVRDIRRLQSWAEKLGVQVVDPTDPPDWM